MAERKRRPGKKKEPAKFSRRMKKKLLVMFSGVMAMLFALIGRLTYIEQVKGEEYEKQVLSQQGYESQSIPFQRGEILDSKGTVLASSVDVYNVILDCKLINEETYDLETRKKVKKYVEPTVEALLQCFPDVTEEEVMAALTEKADSRYFVLRKKLHYEEIREFQELESKVDKKGKKVNPNVQGVWFEKEYQREYPYGNLASKVLGFTTSGNEGIGGLEDYYNGTLNGINGRQYGFLNSDNNFEKTIKDPVNGKTLILTLDLNIQKIIQERIAEFQEEHRDEEHEGPGSSQTGVIVMNPQNGEILAMSDSLVYDLNNPRDLSLYYTEEEINGFSEKQQLDKLNEIWQNYCITYTYEPGSTTKPFTVATALETGKTREWYDCDGMEKIGGHEIHCVLRSGHGPQTMEQSLMNSCNDAMMQMAVEIGKEDFYKYQNIFSFGLQTHIDLPGEPSYYPMYNAETTDAASLATNSFGQNFNVTMIEMIAGFCSLINGGYYYEPHVVNKITNVNGATVQNIEPRVLKQTISESTSELIRQYCKAVVEYGTGKTARPAGYMIGGKTGTAETIDPNTHKRSETEHVVSFIGYAPADDPQVAIYVVVDRPNTDKQGNARFATKIVRNILTEALPYLNIFMTEEVTEEEQQELDALQQSIIGQYAPTAPEGSQEDGQGAEGGEGGTGEGAGGEGGDPQGSGQSPEGNGQEPEGGSQGEGGEGGQGEGGAPPATQGESVPNPDIPVNPNLPTSPDLAE